MLLFRCNVLFIYVTFCFCEIECDQGDKYLNGFVNYLNSVPNKPYNYENGVILNAHQDGENGHNLEVKIRAVDNDNNIKHVKCSFTVRDDGDQGIAIDNDYQCTEEVDDGDSQYSVNPGDTVNGSGTEAAQLEPIHLDNDVQTSDMVTSGEQFVAVPREQPAPCIGCATHVDPEAEGVRDLAELGIKHLDRHETNVKHTLSSVYDVERQVQVINGVRYILILEVNYDNCTSSDNEEHNYNKICKITILEKPWMKLPSGSKYRAILANNCTEEWQFGDNGEVVSQNEGTTNNDETNDGEVFKVIHNSELESTQNKGFISEDDLKQIQVQIIPLNEFFKQQGSDNTEANVKSDTNVKYSVGLNEAVPHTNFDSNINQDQENHNTGSLNEEKKKAIDDFMNIFNFDSYPNFENRPLTAEIATTPLLISTEPNTDGQIISNELFQRKRRQTTQDPNDIQYRKLAEESLEKYMKTSGITEQHQVLKISKVTFQIVAGSITRIEFDIIPTSCTQKCGDENIKHCKAEIWERKWLHSKEIDITCEDNNTKRSKRDRLVGGLTQQNPNDDIYKILSQESLNNYVTTSGVKQYHKVCSVDNVTTQVVSGSLTRLNFKSAPTNCEVNRNGEPKAQNCEISLNSANCLIECNAEVWEQPWLNKKEIKVECKDNSKV